MTELQKMDSQYVANTYKRFPIDIVSGKGSTLVDANGKEYIDMGTGIAVNTFGVCDDEWKNAVIAQLDKVSHTSNLYYTEPGAQLAKMLCEKTGMKKVFFGNSGAEANECAIKVARKYAAEKKGAEYNVILTLVNSFHGRTLTTLAATGQDKFHELFQPLTPGFVHTPANDIEALKKAVAENKIAGILIECVQGEGGVLPLEADFVKAIDEICKAEDIVFMVDEVQTGNGRCGNVYAYMEFGVQPDVVSTAKGLCGGLPLGACLLGEKVENVFSYGDHGSTFGANPICCAGAISTLSRIDDALLAEVKEKSKYIFDTLTGAPGVVSVSGMGLMIGIKTEKPAAEVLAKCTENGVLCLTAKDKIRLLPALNIPMETLKKAIDILKDAIA
ncbi:MAG: acetylornithine/succinylornithine family transaminase [Clostridia bacterium]|nr:acetylornithine/succinylornithine family transaminase [Clostridia bacterium]